MTFYAATLVEVLIIELFVFGIWFKVLLDSIAVKEASVSSKKLILTSVGLVISSLAVSGIVAFRIYEALDHEPNLWAITSFYVLIAASGFMFLVSACIGRNNKLIKLFLLISLIWTVIAAYLGYN